LRAIRSTSHFPSGRWSRPQYRRHTSEEVISLHQGERLVSGEARQQHQRGGGGKPAFMLTLANEWNNGKTIR
jgi:hypothetical protein